MGGYVGELLSPAAYGSAAKLGATAFNAVGGVVSETIASTLAPGVGASIDAVAERYNIAYNFYTQAGFNTERALGHLGGIDFSQSVSVTKLTPGTGYVQYVQNGNVGNYFAPIGTSAETIGISPIGRVPELFTPSQPLQALRSTAADIVDTWTVKGQAYQTSGGGTQFFVPNKKLMLPGTNP